jgi:type II secretory pathway component HofQ
MKKQILHGLFLLAAFCAAAPAFAQEEAAPPEKKQIGEEQYMAVCNTDFVGEPLSLNVVNADIRDILNYITKQYGYDFVLDASVGRKVTSVNFDNIPWNVALNNILEPEDLAIECTRQFFRIKVQIKNIVTPEKEPEAAPLYTVFIKLRKLPACTKKAKCAKKSLALSRLKSSVAERLSKKGQVEIEEPSQTLIITDSRGNLNALVKLVETLDNEEFYNQAGKDK